jgi:hypothetical protein
MNAPFRVGLLASHSLFANSKWDERNGNYTMIIYGLSTV